MRVLIDAVCVGCGESHPDTWIDNARSFVPSCHRCGGALERSWAFAKAPGIVPDGIPGGMLVEHGLCNPVTGEPVRYDSRSEMDREAKRRGLERRVEHVDGDAHTQRFV